MDYEKKYKEAFEKAKKLYNEAKANEYTSDMEDYETMFPELKESEDERIKHEIKVILANTDLSQFALDYTFADMINWLEKQGKNQTFQSNERAWLYLVADVLTWREGIGQYLDNPRVQELAKKLQKEYSQKLYVEKQDESDETKAKTFLINKGYPIDANGIFPTYEEMYDIIKEGLEDQSEIDKASYEVAEKEKYDFVSGQFIECRESFDVFKEGNSYWFEYTGNDNYIGRSDNILNQKFHITPRQLYHSFIQEHCTKEDNANAPIAYGKYVDECLNEASEHFFSEGEDKYSVADVFYACVRCGKSWYENQKPVACNVVDGSEDEKIRKGLIKGLSAMRDTKHLVMMQLI